MSGAANKSLASVLLGLDACTEAIEWAAARPVGLEAWRECPRGDWLLWLAAEAGVDRPTLVLAACDCAQTALRYVPAGDDRPRLAIEAARAWARDPTAAAYAAASDAAASDDAASAAYASASAAAASADDASDAARLKAQRNNATIVRRHISGADVMRRLGETW